VPWVTASYWLGQEAWYEMRLYVQKVCMEDKIPLEVVQVGFSLI
jgi:hypothetical protein